MVVLVVVLLVVVLLVVLLLTVLVVVLLVLPLMVVHWKCWVQHTPGRTIHGLKRLEVLPGPPYRMLRHGCVESILRPLMVWVFRIRALPKAARGQRQLKRMKEMSRVSKGALGNWVLCVLKDSFPRRALKRTVSQPAAILRRFC